jgi:DNA/RNA endonuclease YhcR with UshA esterase domain
MKKHLTLIVFAILFSTFARAQNVGIGTTTPQSKLSIGSTSQFQIDSIGNIKKVNNIPTIFPSVQGSSGQVLTNNGSGNLSWSNNIPYAVASGTNAITFSLTPAITSYTSGTTISFKAVGNNTGNVTVSINGLTAQNLYKNVSSNLSPNDILNGQIISIIYDGTNFQLITQPNQSGTLNGSNAQTLIYLGDGF